MFLSINLILLYQKNIKLNPTNYVIMEIPNKWELQQFAFNHSSDIDFKGFAKTLQKCTSKQYSFLVIDVTLALDDPLRFKKIS